MAKSSRVPILTNPNGPSPYAYRHLMSEKDFLRVKARAQRVQGIDLASIDFANNEVRFLVNSVSRPGLKHTVVIRFNSLDGNIVSKLSTHGVAALLRRVGIRVFCSCEAWMYWGFQYKSERREYGAFRLGVKYPKVRNPYLRGFVCKHVYSVLGVLASGTIMNNIAKKLKDYLSEQQTAQIRDALSKLQHLKLV